LDQQLLVAQIYLYQRCAIGTQAILLLLELQALVKVVALVMVQLDLLQVGLGLG
jgi:hypothetical protein